MGFPDDFLWAAATSNVAAEGAARRADWHRWEGRRNLDPSEAGVGFAAAPDSPDFARLVELGFHHLAITVEWARIEPFAGSVERGELHRIEELFVGARDAGIQPWAILHHGSLPGWFSEDTDGFARVGGPPIQWSRHVDRVAETLDGIAVGWIPSVDPIGWAVDAYRLGVRPPGRRDEEAARDAIAGVLDSVFDASRLLSSGSAPVMSWFGSGHPESDIWIEAIRDGVLRLPGRGPVERSDLADAFDLIGIDWADADAPEHLVDRLHDLRDLLPGREAVLCGMSVPTAEDDHRGEVLGAWLDAASEAISEGTLIRGVMFDPVIDGYDFGTGWDMPRGLIDRDRSPKPSLGWIKAQR